MKHISELVSMHDMRILLPAIPFREGYSRNAAKEADELISTLNEVYTLQEDITTLTILQYATQNQETNRQAEPFKKRGSGYFLRN